MRDNFRTKVTHRLGLNVLIRFQFWFSNNSSQASQRKLNRTKARQLTSDRPKPNRNPISQPNWRRAGSQHRHMYVPSAKTSTGNCKKSQLPKRRQFV